MKKQRIAFATILFLSVGIFSGCGTIERLQEQSVSKPPMPAGESQFTNLPFAKAVNPAFQSEVANKWIHLTGAFVMLLNTVVDLPAEYKNGYVRFYVMDPENPSAVSMNFLIVKANSDIVFDLKRGDIIDIWAYVVPTIGTSRATGRQFGGQLFLVDHIAKVAK